MTPVKIQLQPFEVTWYHPTEEYQERSWKVLSNNDDFGYQVVCATVWGTSPAAASEEVRSWYFGALVPICVRSCVRQSGVLEASKPVTTGHVAFHRSLAAA